MKKKSIQIVGSFATNYSLAKVNRGLAKALHENHKNYDTFLYQDRNKIDKWPDDNDLRQYPVLNDIWTKDAINSDIVIYNDFPKEGFVKHGLAELPGKIKIMYLAWEETIYPEMWVNEINESLHAVMAASTFVRDILRKNGVKVPIFIVSNAIDDDIRISKTDKYPLKTKKTFKFLHISTGRQRKGVDVLIKSYFSEFTKEDDVCLVIKSFPGPDNVVEDMLRELRHDNSPEVEHIFSSELTDQDIANLTATCDVGVYPSRTEGFGLPIAESMFHRKPVIATNYSAYLDFANEENAFLIDYELVEAKDSEFANIGAKWAEPSIKDLKSKMRYLFELHKSNNLELITEKIEKAYQSSITLSWKNSAKSLVNAIEQIEQYSDLKQENAAVLTTLNGEDGISEYVRDLYPKVEAVFNQFYYLSNTDIHDRVYDDAKNVIRCWETGTTNFNKLLEEVENKKIGIAHIQYHSGSQFSIEALDNLIDSLFERKIKIFLTLHAIKGDSFDITLSAKSFGRVNTIFTQNEEDVKYLVDRLNLDNVQKFTHPRFNKIYLPKEQIKKDLGLESHSNVIVTHGMLAKGKFDILSLLNAIKELKNQFPDLLYLAVNAVSSNNTSSVGYFEELQNEVKKLQLENNVIFIKEFLDRSQIFTLMSIADIGISPYFDAGESGSGAVGKFLALGLPIVVPNIKMFEEVKNIAMLIEKTDKENLYNSISKLLKSSELRNEYSVRSTKFTESISFESASIMMLISYGD